MQLNMLNFPVFVKIGPRDYRYCHTSTLERVSWADVSLLEFRTLAFDRRAFLNGAAVSVFKHSDTGRGLWVIRRPSVSLGNRS